MIKPERQFSRSLAEEGVGKDVLALHNYQAVVAILREKIARDDAIGKSDNGWVKRLDLEGRWIIPALRGVSVPHGSVSFTNLARWATDVKGVITDDFDSYVLHVEART